MDIERNLMNQEGARNMERGTKLYLQPGPGLREVRLPRQKQRGGAGELDGDLRRAKARANPSLQALVGAAARQGAAAGIVGRREAKARQQVRESRR